MREPIDLPAGVNGPNGLAIDPNDQKRLYLAAWGRKAENGAVDGGIWMSNDGGRTWSNVLARDQHVYDVTIDPRNHDIAQDGRILGLIIAGEGPTGSVAGPQQIEFVLNWFEELKQRAPTK